MTRLDDAISHLSCALGQVVPTDDAIIVGHMRDALALLREHRAAERATASRRVLCSCRHWIDWHAAEYVGAMRDEVADLELRNCPRCGSTRAVEVGGEQMGEVA